MTTAPASTPATAPAPLLTTPLHALHRELGARMVPFAGHDMPVQYPQGILAERGVEADYFHYLDTPPAEADIRRVMGLLGFDDPRDMARRSESKWKELGLDDVSAEEIIAAMVDNPILIERPIVIVGDKAVIARPPERVLEIL